MDMLHIVLHGVIFVCALSKAAIVESRHCGNHSWLARSHVEPAIHSKERFPFNMLARALSIFCRGPER